MGKGKIMGIGVGIVVAFFVVIIVIGASTAQQSSQEDDSIKTDSSPQKQPQTPPITTTTTTAPPATTEQTKPVDIATTATQPTNAYSIDNFAVLGESTDDQYQVRFSLLDSNQAVVSEDGKVSFMIRDSTGRILYQSQFEIKKSDFQIYQFTLTGQQFLAYAWNIPTSEVERGIGLSTGDAKITFTSNHDGNTLNATYGAVFISTMTEDEVKQYYNDNYIQTSMDVNKTVTQNGFEITLLRVGWFDHLKYTTWGDPQTDFRADLVIKNVGSEPAYIPNSFVIIDDKDRQYDSSLYAYGGDLGFREIYPNISAQGYEVFEGVDKDVSHIQLLTKQSVMNKDTFAMEDVYWKFDVDLK